MNVDVSSLSWFSSTCSLKKEKKIYLELYYLKETCNKMEIEMVSENESQLKRIRKPLLLLTQEESLAKKVQKYFCLFD